MAVFNYKVVDKNGKNKKGTIEAPNRDGAEKKLKADGYAIMSLTEQNSPFSGGLIKKKVKSKDLAVFCKQFSAVIRAGVTIISTGTDGRPDRKQNTAESSYGCKDIC